MSDIELPEKVEKTETRNTDDDKKSKVELPEEPSEKEQNRKKYPRGVFFLLGSKVCERFSYFCIRTVLTLYIVNKLDYSENNSAKIYHAFQIVIFSSPIVGAIMADVWLGKFWTILSISILYACGNMILALGAIPNTLTLMRAASIVGLSIIGFGNGGIKPIVSAFGGDQFKKGQEEMRQHFFALIYFAIKVGSLMANALSPTLKADIKCFGEATCFSLVFFISALLSVIALVLFAVGKPFYMIKPTEGSVLVSVLQCICNALYNKITKKGGKKEHWLDYADDQYDFVLKRDIERLSRILVIYIPLTLFWALYAQQFSKWVIQATKMDGKLTGGVYIKPDHMQIFNPILFLIMIPVFNWIIYPLLSKVNLCNTPLKRMAIGGFMCAFSYVITAFIQVRIEAELPLLPPEGEIEILVINNSPCFLEMRSPRLHNLNSFDSLSLYLPISKTSDWSFVPTDCGVSDAKKYLTNLNKTFNSMMVTLDDDDKLVIHVTNDTRKKPLSGDSLVRLVFSIDYEFTDKENVSFLIKGSKSTLFLFPDQILRPEKTGMTQYCSLIPGEYKLFLPLNEIDFEEEPIGKFAVDTGGSYTVSILQKEAWNITAMNTFITVQPNSVHRLWQVPQYVILTAGEVMFAITGLDFSYSQAPPSLKSVVQAMWYIPFALGNFLVVLLNSFTFERYSYEFFMYAALMASSMALFGILAYFYEYADSDEK
ncbi:solute carrier family 15 member 2 [Trichonephila clavata]|uniref:Solute carrier family 15 member 2 n=1 Tax=Trichonephila clavata TaxID=2740835 RepID=A0A8X6LTU8_TRICU|nr:solute carrier family 15 member 2 [Trichonephila clavata]